MLPKLIADALLEGRPKLRDLEAQYQAWIAAREEVPVWHFSAALYAEALLHTVGRWRV